MILLGIVVSAWLLQQLVAITLRKEGFANATRDSEPEDRMTPEAFAYNLLQTVKGPIRRLTTQLADVGNWRERVELARLTPVELARRGMQQGSVST